MMIWTMDLLKRIHPIYIYIYIVIKSSSCTMRWITGEISRCRSFCRVSESKTLELQFVLQRRQVQVQPPKLPRTTFPRGMRVRRHRLMPPHVAAESLAHRKHQAAHGAGVKLRPHLLHRVAPVSTPPRPCVARPVASERLERRKPAAAGLALELAAPAGATGPARAADLFPLLLFAWEQL